MQRVCNYGSFLQAWALQHILMEMGHEVCFVDYEPGPSLCPPQKDSLLRRLKGWLRALWQLRSRGSRIARRRERNQDFARNFARGCLPLLGMPKERSTRTQVDVLVIGSDEVFNCMQSGPEVGYSRELFGYGSRASKIISYAASFGFTTLPMLREQGIDREVGQMLSRFSGLSVRDENSREIVRALTGREAALHMDPVLLYDFNPLVPTQAVCRDTVLVYAYSGRVSTEEAGAIRAFARKHGKRLVSVGTYQPFCDENIPVVSPFALLAYVRDAEYIVSDTFHGCVFAIKYYKKFCVFIRSSNRQKIEGLLSAFCEKKRCVENLNDFDAILNQSVNKALWDDRMSDNKCKAIQYLKEQINEL